MRRLFICIAVAFASVVAYAFEPHTAYCQVRADWSGDYSVTFDSQTTDLIKSGKGFIFKLADADGNLIKSETSVDIINYLSTQGWEVNSMAAGGSSKGMDLTYYYLMEKKVESQEELVKGIQLKAQ